MTHPFCMGGFLPSQVDNSVMSYQLTPAVLVSAGGFVLSLFLAMYALQKYRRRPGQPLLLAFAGYMFALVLFQFSSALADFLTSEEATLLVTNLINTVTAWVALYALVGFALTYADQQHLIKRWMVGLALGQILLLIARCTSARLVRSYHMPRTSAQNSQIY